MRDKNALWETRRAYTTVYVFTRTEKYLTNFYDVSIATFSVYNTLRSVNKSYDCQNAVQKNAHKNASLEPHLYNIALVFYYVDLLSNEVQINISPFLVHIRAIQFRKTVFHAAMYVLCKAISVINWCLAGHKIATICRLRKLWQPYLAKVPNSFLLVLYSLAFLFASS